MDPHIFPFNITVTQVTDFADPEAGRVQEGDHGFWLQVRKSRDKELCFLLSWDKREIGIKLPHRKLSRIPGFMENIYGKEAQLGDTGVYGAVRKRTFLLKPEDKIPEFGPGDILRLFEENVLQVI